MKIPADRSAIPCLDCCALPGGNARVGANELGDLAVGTVAGSADILAEDDLQLPYVLPLRAALRRFARS